MLIVDILSLSREHYPATELDISHSTDKRWLWWMFNEPQAGIADLSIHVYLSDENCNVHHLLVSLQNADRQEHQTVQIYLHFPKKFLSTLQQCPGAFESQRHNELYAVILKPFQDNSMRKSLVKSISALTSKSKYSIILNGDSNVSRYIFKSVAEFAIPALDFPWTDEGLAAVSIQNIFYNPSKLLPFSPPSTHSIYYLQHAVMSGLIFTPNQWAEFCSWYQFLDSNFDPIIPNSHTNSWNEDKSLRKYFLRYLYETMKSILYLNTKSDQMIAYSLLDQAPNNLIILDSRLSPLSIPDIDRLSLYNAPRYGPDFELINPSNNKALPRVDSFDKCTLIMMVYDRYPFIMDRIKHYQNYTRLDRIVIVWNKLDVPIPEYPKFKIPVHFIMQKKNSLNNRYRPFDVIQTDCILNMDDDWDMPFDYLETSYQVWKRGFFEHIVGYRALARYHEYHDDRWHYHFESDVVSIILPSGSIIHRKYLEMYTYKAPQESKDLVDALINCEDLLMNFVIARAIQSAPFPIYKKLKGHLHYPGLSNDDTHLKEREICLTEFEKHFNGIPLKYTNHKFIIKSHKNVPSLSEFKQSDRFEVDKYGRYSVAGI